MKINIGDILIAKPIKALVVVVGIEKSLANLAWLKNYWKTKYNLKLPRFFDIIEVRFPSHDKIYEYPRYRKCIKRPLRQKKYRKLFKLEQNKKKAIRKIKIKNLFGGNDFFEDEGLLREVFDV